MFLFNKVYCLVKDCLSTTNDINFTCFHRLPQIYEEYRHSIQNADAKKDLKWWSNNHGVGMAMNWPQFEVGTILFKKLCCIKLYSIYYFNSVYIYFILNF